MSGKDSSKNVQSKADRPDGATVDVNLYIASLQDSQSPINFRVRLGQRGFTEGLTIIEYSLRITQGDPGEDTAPQRE